MPKIKHEISAEKAALAGRKIPKIWNIVGISAFAYLVGYSLLEASGGSLYAYWTSIFEGFCSEISASVPGISKISKRVAELGYSSRVPYIEHTFTVTLLMVLATPLFNVFNYKNISIVTRKAKLQGKLIAAATLAPMVLLFVVFLYFYYGIHVKEVTFSGFRPHSSNFQVVLYSLGILYVTQISFSILCVGILSSFDFFVEKFGHNIIK